MPTIEFLELKEMIEAVDKKLSAIAGSLVNCKSHCYVANPPSKWRGLGQALLALVKF